MSDGEMRNIYKINIWIELTNRCNYNCLYCYNDKEEKINKKNKFNIKILSHIKKQLDNNFHLDGICISGGEPFLVQNIGDILEALSNWNVPKQITTNGSLLTDNYLLFTIENGFTLHIPLLASYSGLHDYLTSTKGAWENSIKIISKVVRAQGHVVIVFVGTKLNINELPKIIEIAAILGVKYIILNIFYPISGSGKQHNFQIGLDNWQNIMDIIASAISIAKKNRIILLLGTPIPYMEKSLSLETMCFGRKQKRIIIDKFGNIRTCLQESVYIGNIFTDSIVQVMRSDSFCQREMVLERCSYWNGIIKNKIALNKT